MSLPSIDPADQHFAEFIRGRRVCPRLEGEALGNPLSLPDVTCSERYAVEVACGGRYYLFTRRDLGDHRAFETLVRHRSRRQFHFSNASVALPHSLLMSHNAAVHCLNGKTLVAFGGQAHDPRSADWQGNDRGILRATAPATAPPLQWSEPVLAVSGSPSLTGCMDAVSEGPFCEYDGKISVVRFQQSTYLFTRSNLHKGGGGRHVQVARSADGVRGWSRFEQLQIRGVAHGAKEVNIYFLSVRVVKRPGQASELLGFFPGVLGGALGAGVYKTTSADGVKWSAPIRLLTSQVDGDHTRDYPVDGAPFASRWSSSSASAAALGALAESYSAQASAGEAPLGASSDVWLSIQIDVDLRLKRTPSMDQDCDASIGRPRVCSYRIHHPPSTLSAPSSSVAARAALPLPRTASDVRSYLSAVYPAARSQLRSASDAQLIRLYESLDYFYAGSVCGLRPKPRNCMAPRSTAQRGASPPPPTDSINASDTYPVAPYFPSGAFYTALGRPAWRHKPFLEASFDRHARPVMARNRPTTLPIYSSWGAKMGPAPSWTSPLASVRYGLYPSGLHSPLAYISDAFKGAQKNVFSPGEGGKNAAELAQHNVRATIWHAAGSHGRHSSAIAFDVRNHPRVIELFALRDGDLIEVEQWGGWAANDCPPICGLWANVWKGTGVAMRVASPFVGLSKASTIVDMILALADRSPTGIIEFASAAQLLQPARRILREHAGTPFAVCVAAALLLHHPCEGAAADRDLAHLVERWLSSALQTTPHELLAALRAIGNESRASSSSVSVDGHAKRKGGQRRLVLSEAVAANRQHAYVLHWLYGVCGVGGPLPRTGYGWDGLLALLACMLGHHTIILAASPNDNGLLHQELVDFELPAPHGWPRLPSGKAPPNSLKTCRRPFELFQADKASGGTAMLARRKQLLEFWRSGTAHGSKFVLPHTLPNMPSTNQQATRSSHPAGSLMTGCMLRFGAAPTEPAGSVDACRITGEDEELPPTAAKACWAWCEGATSAAHAQVSLFHVLGSASALVPLDPTDRVVTPIVAMAADVKGGADGSNGKGVVPMVQYSGFCDVDKTSGDCNSDSRGVANRTAPHRLRATSKLQRCRRLCLACANCNFVSVDLARGTCSWFRSCSMPLRHSVDGTPWVTVQVAKPRPCGSPGTSCGPAASVTTKPVDFIMDPSSQQVADAAWETARIASATRRFSKQNVSAMCDIMEKRSFALPKGRQTSGTLFGIGRGDGHLGPRQQLLGSCVPLVQVMPRAGSGDRLATAPQASSGDVAACCALCADTLGCTAWTLLQGGECCLRRWSSEGTVRHVTSTAGIVRSPCTVNCALPFRPFGWDRVRLPTASADDIPWLKLSLGKPPPEAVMSRKPAAKAPSIAVCMAGQVRTLVHPSVARAFHEHVLDGGRHDLFAVLSTGSDGNGLPPGHPLARSTSRQLIEDQRLPRPCELQAALKHLQPLRTRFVLNSHNGREPCLENFATIQMVATSSCVRLVEEYERDYELESGANRPRAACVQEGNCRPPRLYRYMLRTRPDTYWRVPLPLTTLASRLGAHRTVLTANDWHLLAPRGLWPVLHGLANVTCDQRCNGRPEHYLGTIFDDMNEYCLLLMHLAKHGVAHMEASHPIEDGIYHYAVDKSHVPEGTHWLHAMRSVNTPLVRWSNAPAKRPHGTRIVCHGPPIACSFCGAGHPPCPSAALDMKLPRAAPRGAEMAEQATGGRAQEETSWTSLSNSTPEPACDQNKDFTCTSIYADYVTTTQRYAQLPECSAVESTSPVLNCNSSSCSSMNSSGASLDAIASPKGLVTEAV